MRAEIYTIYTRQCQIWLSSVKKYRNTTRYIIRNYYQEYEKNAQIYTSIWNYKNIWKYYPLQSLLLQKERRGKVTRLYCYRYIKYGCFARINYYSKVWQRFKPSYSTEYKYFNRDNTTRAPIAERDQNLWIIIHGESSYMIPLHHWYVLWNINHDSWFTQQKLIIKRNRENTAGAPITENRTTVYRICAWPMQISVMYADGICQRMHLRHGYCRHMSEYAGTYSHVLGGEYHYH